MDDFPIEISHAKLLGKPGTDATGLGFTTDVLVLFDFGILLDSIGILTVSQS